MSQPETGPVDEEVVATWAKIPADDARRPELHGTCLAVNDVVRSLPVAELTGTDPDTGDPVVEDWPARVVEGANMLVKRMWRRRDTPAGVQQIGDDGSALYVARSDPDVSFYLQLGAYEKPSVG